MSSATSIALPQTGAARPAGDAVEAALAQLKARLDLDWVALSRVQGSSLTHLHGDSGDEVAEPLARWKHQAVAAGGPLVVADTGAVRTNDDPVGFFAGMVLREEQDGGVLLLSMADRRARSRAMAEALAALALEVVGKAIPARAQLPDHKTWLARDHDLFDRASRTARIGIWSFDLVSETMRWTDSVYDLFGLPRGMPLDRSTALTHYTPAARVAMEAARAHAIATCSEFSIDVEIVTAQGEPRWMRLTGNVEARDGVAVRIFGMKQNITEEKLLADRTRYLAETDVMTGLANRSQFQGWLAALPGRPIGGLLLVDLDRFKQINDNFGHAFGDECLREAAQRLAACCGGATLVARIGGDEFAVLIDEGCTEHDLAALGRHIVQCVGQDFVHADRSIHLSASVGAASYRGGSGHALFHHADTALYAAKAAGRNTSHVHGG